MNQRLTKDRVCKNALPETLYLLLENPNSRPALAYCLAWLKVAGGGFGAADLGTA